MAVVIVHLYENLFQKCNTLTFGSLSDSFVFYFSFFMKIKRSVYAFISFFHNKFKKKNIIIRTEEN